MADSAKPVESDVVLDPEIVAWNKRVNAFDAANPFTYGDDDDDDGDAGADVSKRSGGTK